MGTPAPRPRGGASLSAELRASRDDRQQIRRLLSTPPKVPATVAAVAGAYGMNEVYAVDGTFKMLAGQNINQPVEWGSVYDPHSGTPGASGVFVEPQGDVLIVPAGWYSIALTAAIWWPDQASAPKSVSLYIQGGDAASYNNESVFETCSTWGGWGVMQVMSQGPTYLKAGREIHVEVRTRSDQTPPADSTGGYCAFSITRLG